MIELKVAALAFCFVALGVLAEALHVSIGWLVGGEGEEGEMKKSSAQG